MMHTLTKLLIAAGLLGAAALTLTSVTKAPPHLSAANNTSQGKDTNMNTELELKLILPESVRAGADLEARVEIINRSGSSKVLNTRLGVSAAQRGGELHFEICDASGKEIPFSARVNIGTPEPTDFAVVAPQASFARSVKLTNYFPLGVPGSYHIRAIYTNSYEGQLGDQAAWKGRAESPIASLQIEP